MTARQTGLAALLLVSVSAAAAGQTVAVPNPSFEDGDKQPAGWTLSGGKGDWLAADAADGKRAVSVTGSGEDSSSWRTGPLALKPGAVYVLRFKARSLGASGGTPVTGPAFSNRDLGDIPTEWKSYESVFATPRTLSADESYLRFGQWQVKGGVAFDAVELAQAMPVYVRQGDLALGEGESVLGREYVFDAPFRGTSRNHSRPLVAYACTFNSDRWVLGKGGEVVYRHQVAGRRQTAAEVHVSVTWHAAGEVAVEASADGKSWQRLGTLGKVFGGTFSIPATILPADEVGVRLRGRPAQGGDKKSDAVSLQVGGYSYKAALAGDPATLVGATRFLAVTQTDPRLRVEIDSLGDGLPGGENAVVGRVVVAAEKPIAVLAAVTVDRAPPVASDFTSLSPGAHPINKRYALPGPGTHTLAIQYSLPDAPAGAFRAEVSLHVPDLHDTSYGELLPGSGPQAGLWWAASGWKISRARPAPEAKGEAILIRAARNEAEAAQLVVRPEKALGGFTARPGALAGPGGASIPAGNVEILRVRYLMIAHPTDATGCVAPWPDPLPSMAGPVDLEAGANQPLWVRVSVPASAKPGRYTGRIRLAAEGWAAEAPLAVEVYDFALPDRMTCQTAFGFSHGNVWRYQKLEKPEDRRAVLEKYLADFSRHHIAPYDPAPLDPLKVAWPKGADSKPTLVPQFDWTAWDAAMTRAMDQYHFNSFMVHVPGMGGGTYQRRYEPELLGYREDTPEYKTAFTNYGRALQEHLRAKGWLDRAYVYWFDEPDPKDYAFVMNGFRKLREAAPDLVRMLTEQVEPDLVGGPNLWCPLTPNYDHARAGDRRRAGERFWWYVCCGPKAPYATLFIDHPATELRVWLWQTWQRRIDGILVWQTNYWTSPTAYPDARHPQNPYEDPMSWVSDGSAAAGARTPWGNGDGRFVYPPEAAAGASPAAPVLDGPVDSIRLEMLRDGIEDYEYLAILRRLLEAKGAKLPAGRRAAFAALLEVPADIAKDMTTFTKDPAPIERRRHAVAQAIETVERL